MTSVRPASNSISNSSQPPPIPLAPSPSLTTLSQLPAVSPASAVPADYTARLFPDLPYENVNVEMIVPNWDKGELGNYVEVDENRVISFIHADAEFAFVKLIVGDRILRIADRDDLSSIEMDDIFHHQVGKICLIVYRRRHTSPVPIERMNRVGLLPCPGFGYFLLNVVRPASDDISKRTGMGFFLKLVNNKIYVCKTAPHTPSADFFAVGDAIFDMNGFAIPFNQPQFVGNFFAQYRDCGRFSCIVERPVNQDQLDNVNTLIASFFPAPQQENIRMSIDAATIGVEAARMHATIFRKCTPKSILKPVLPLMSPPMAPALSPIHTESLTAFNKQSMYMPVSSPLPKEKATSTQKPNNSKPRTTFSNNRGNGKGRKMKGARPSESAERIVDKTIVVDETGIMDETPKPADANSSGTKISIWPRRIECSIGTDVPEEKQLKKVEKRAKIKKGQGFLNKLYDMF